MTAPEHRPADSPCVTVVIPVLNDAVELAECLRLLATQSHPPDEVVVVDNGSVDDSVAVATAAGAVVVHEPRRGIPYAAATGYDAATGDVIARLDADSRPGPQWIERAVSAMADARVDAVTGPGRFHDLPRGLGRVASALYLGAYFGSTALAVAGVPLWGSSMALRRSSWQRVSALVHRELDVHDDMDLTFALGAHSVVRFDRRFSVGVSGRSLRPGPQWRSRWGRALTTLRVNWALEPPWERWQRRLRP